MKIDRTVALAVLDRKGAETRSTRPFDRFRPDVQKRILGDVELDEDEEPIVASTLGVESFVLVTTRGVWSKRDGVMERIPLGELLHVSAAASSTDGRLGVSQIEIERTDGTKTRLDVEPGPPLVGLMSVLRLKPRPTAS